MLTECVPIADPQPCRLTGIFEVLRRFADDAASIELVVRANGRSPGKMNVGTHDASFPQLYLVLDHGVRTNLHAGIQPGFRMHDGSRMNQGRLTSRLRSVNA